MHRVTLTEQQLARAVEASLALVENDLTGAVYERLFARWPAMAAEFWQDRSGAIRGEMLEKAFEAILDLCGQREWAPAHISNERLTHSSCGIPDKIFAEFFTVIAESVAADLGPLWSTEMAAGWDWLDAAARSAMVAEDCSKTVAVH